MRITQLLALATSAMFAMPASADTHQEIRDLSREKMKITMQVGKLFRDKKLGGDQAYEASKKTAFDASRAYVKAQKNHPKLKGLVAKSDAAQKKWIDARVAKDAEGAKAARKAYTDALIEIGKTARGIPELVELQQKAITASKASEEKKKELLATTPEGRELISKIDALDARIAALRKKLAGEKP